MVPMGTDRLNAREKKMGSRLGEGEKQQLKKDREKGGRGRKGVPWVTRGHLPPTPPLEGQDMEEYALRKGTIWLWKKEKKKRKKKKKKS